MIVGDVLMVLSNTTDDIAVHDRYVINIEEQLEVFGVDLLDEIDTEIDVVPEVARVAFHGMGRIAGIEVFEN